jgi:putative FmdB family regulatory protein
MPIYEYACKSCGVTFEKFQRIEDDPVSKFEYCPNRQEGCEIQRLISAPSVIKGMESTPTGGNENPQGASEPSQQSPAQPHTPETLMANRAQSLQNQIQQRIQTFMKKAKSEGKL